MAGKTAPSLKEISQELNADEKILSGKLMEELHSGGTAKETTPEEPTLADLEGARVSQKIPEVPVIPKISATPEVPIVPAVPELAIKAKRGFHLPKFPFKLPHRQNPEALPVPVATQQLTTDVLLKLIDEKTKKISSDDFITIKISKQGLLILTGLLLILIWVFPLIELSALRIKNQLLPPTVNTSEITNEPRIRVHVDTNTLEATHDVKLLLQSAGFDRIDFVYDPILNTNTVMVATHSDNGVLRQRLLDALSGKYRLASESADLTQDSDFDASVLVGKDAKI